MRSQLHMGEQGLWCGAQYNSNNGWIFNGTNGNLDNNNKYNTNGSRRLDYDISDYINQSGFSEFSLEIFKAYVKCRKNKRNTLSQLEFEYDIMKRMNLTISLWVMEYVSQRSIAFIIMVPRIREVIAANFADRVAQTWFDMHLKPYLEEDMYHPDSYSCRKGKGGLRAVLQLRDYIYEMTNGYVYDDLWIIKRDISAFFMNIDTEILERDMVDFIQEHFGEDEQLRNMLMWLARILYRSLPQEHCIRKSHPLAWNQLDRRKSMFGRVIGVPIGNLPSQTGANVTTSRLLWLLHYLMYLFVHYTDDTVPLIRDKKRWKYDEKCIERMLREEMHLEWHKNKRYCQHYSKGVEFLGYKIRFDRILPSDRIAHNFIWKAKCAIRKAEESKAYMYKHKEDFMSVMNSYCGLLKWCNSYRLRAKVFDMLRKSPWAKIFDFHDNSKVTIKKSKTRRASFIRINRMEKRKMRRAAR